MLAVEVKMDNIAYMLYQLYNYYMFLVYLVQRLILFCGALVIVLFPPPKILFLISILNSRSQWLCRGVIWFQSGDLLMRYLWRTLSCTSYCMVILFPLFSVFPFISFFISALFFFTFTGCFSFLSALNSIITTLTLSYLISIFNDFYIYI